MKNLGKLLWLGLVCWQFSGGPVGATVPVQQRGHIIVAESAGAQLHLSDNLANLISQMMLPLQVEITDWSTLNVATDYDSQWNFMVKSQKLANRVMDLHRRNPNVPIYLIGNGSGTLVVVKATELLPPHTVQRVFLLGPTLSCNYDMRRSLQSSCEGIEVFHCRHDLALELAMQYRGTSDRGCKMCAGLVGFAPRITSAADASLFANLKQCNIRDTGDGNEANMCHLRYLSTSFLRTSIIPVLENSLRMRAAAQTQQTPPPPAPPPQAPSTSPLPPPNLPPPISPPQTSPAPPGLKGPPIAPPQVQPAAPQLPPPGQTAAPQNSPARQILVAPPAPRP
jgi:hypothetical protein